MQIVSVAPALHCKNFKRGHLSKSERGIKLTYWLYKYNCRSLFYTINPLQYDCHRGSIFVSASLLNPLKRVCGT